MNTENAYGINYNFKHVLCSESLQKKRKINVLFFLY